MRHHGRLPISEAPRSHGAARVLLVEDDPRIAILVGEMLRVEWTQGLVVAHAQGVIDAAAELVEHDATCVLLGLPATGRDGLAAFDQLRSAAPDVPIVVVAEDQIEELGIALVRAGAQDFLRRSELNSKLLARAVRYAIERNRSEVELAHQALHDPLTALPNRALFVDRMTVALDRSRRTGTPVAVLFLDVDNFKRINDSMGHAAGDLLLTVLADRFTDMLRPMDTVARFGGDEFTFLLEELESEREAMRIAERINHSASRAVKLGDAETSVAVSIGIAFVTDPVVDPDSVIGDADAAMYRAKELGGARFEVYEKSPRKALPEDGVDALLAPG
jgi:diguanylate cyclase (GGDEF)-like protein